MNELSKKYKLAKIYQVEGKSKYLFPRLNQEGLNNLAELHNRMFPAKVGGTVLVKSRWQRFIDWLKRKFHRDGGQVYA